MTELIHNLQHEWRSSKSFRVWTSVAALILFIEVLLATAWQLKLGDFTWADEQFGVDLQKYLAAGQRFSDRQTLYLPPQPDLGMYVYSPFFAMVCSLFAFLPYKLMWVVDLLLHLIAYSVFYWRWFMIAQHAKLERMSIMLVRLFPLWLIFTGLMGEITYQNVYIFMALLGTLLIEAVLKEETGKSILWLSLLLPVKPQWAFALGVPLIWQRWRFLLKVLSNGFIIHLGTILVTFLVAGNYALAQYNAYAKFLQTLPSTLYWNTLAVEGHIGYNNSIMQLVNFFTNHAPASYSLTRGVQVLLLAPLAGLAWLHYRRSAIQGAIEAHEYKLTWAFLLYLGAFFCVDVVIELNLGIVIFIYLLATLTDRKLKITAWVIFAPYALSYVVGMLVYAAHLPDPASVIPAVFIAMLGLYTLLLWQLWNLYVQLHR